MKENQEEGDNRKPTERLNLIKTVKKDKTENLIAISKLFYNYL